jgi:c-di-GMP-binding flagellar brake protein YcgR
VFDEQRGRYEIEFEVEESFFHSGQEALVHLAVVGVRHRKARRTAPRVGVSVQLGARVRYGHSMPRDTELIVRLIDISATGLAFVTDRELAAGDMFMLPFRLGDRDLKVEARVVRVDPAPYGRYRAGCEIVEISDADRRAITALAEQAEERGSQDERRPEVVAALADVREARAQRRSEHDFAPGENPAVG